MALWRLCQCCVAERNRFEETGFDEYGRVSCVKRKTSCIHEHGGNQIQHPPFCQKSPVGDFVSDFFSSFLVVVCHVKTQRNLLST